MSREFLIAAIVILAVGAGALGYALWDAKKEPSGVEISIGQKGISVQEK